MNPEIHVHPNENGELIIRQGEALQVSNPKSHTFETTITGPGNWYEGKSYDYKKANVIVSHDDLSIKLFIGEHETSGTVTVVGSLKEFEDLTKFRINRSGTFSQKQLASLLKMNRIYFADRDENLQIVSNLEKFKARVTQEIENGNDFKGNKRQLFEQQVTHDLILSFKLNIPLFKGEPAQSFMVDVNFDITDGSTTFWLESVDLKELQDKTSKQIINREIKRLKDLTIMYT